MKQTTHRSSVFHTALVLVAAAIVATVGAFAEEQKPDPAEAKAEQEVINAVLRTATIYVKNWDASITFYTEYLGYDILAELPVKDEKSLKTLGAKPGVTARIAYLKANNSLIERPFAGVYLGLIGFNSDDVNEYKREKDSAAAMLGEVVLAHQVVGIESIYENVQKDGLKVVAEIGLSGSGKSRSFSVIDPNGIRVEVYEFLPGEEPLKNP